MKKILLFLILFTSITLSAQNDPVLVIDNVNITFKTGVSLPYWLKAGQTVNLGANAKSASILEFTVANNNLVFSQAISLTATQTVPANKVWKIEGIGVTTQSSFIPSSNGLSGSGSSSSSTSNLPTIYQSPKKYDTPGTYNWQVPPGITSICIEVWGGGGRGGSGPPYYVGGGGGGGGYGYQCFAVVPGTTYTVTVGCGTGVSFCNGTVSSFGSLITATGGDFGGNGTSTAHGIGGIGGTSSATFNISGNNGYTGGTGVTGGTGGTGANGGTGGKRGGQSIDPNPPTSGSFPGGGGGGAFNNGTPGAGASGQVIIYW